MGPVPVPPQEGDSTKTVLFHFGVDRGPAVGTLRGNLRRIAAKHHQQPVIVWGEFEPDYLSGFRAPR